MTIVSAEYQRTTGLGNKLFPWARAKILAEQLQCPVKAYRWFSPRGAAVTRGGINYRHALSKVWLVGNFRRDKLAISDFEYNQKFKDLPITFLGTLDEIDVDPKVDMHYSFCWEREQNFSDLWHYRDQIKQYINSITKPVQVKYLKSFDNQDFIALNIRTGKDFRHKVSDEHGYYFTELDWFISALAITRQKYGNLPAFVVSDGGPKQLGPILAMENVHLVKTHTAIADLQILLKAKVLLGSGCSTFSGWASFLGGMDTFTSPETPFDHLQIKNPASPQIVSVL